MLHIIVRQIVWISGNFKLM